MENQSNLIMILNEDSIELSEQEILQKQIKEMELDDEEKLLEMIKDFDLKKNDTDMKPVKNYFKIKEIVNENSCHYLKLLNQQDSCIKGKIIYLQNGINLFSLTNQNVFVLGYKKIEGETWSVYIKV